MIDPPTLAKGDQVTLTWNGIEHRAAIVMASSNSVGILVEFAGVIGGFFNAAPLLWDEDHGTYRTVVGRVPVQVRKVLHA